MSRTTGAGHALSADSHEATPGNNESVHSESDNISESDRTVEPAVPAVESQSRFLQSCLWIALIILVCQWCWLSLQRPEPLPWQRGESFTRYFCVDINHATWVEWLQLKGIGQTMAHRIVADREANGPFLSIDDLQRVDGIGPATLDQIRPWLTIGHDHSRESRLRQPDEAAPQQPGSI